MFTAAELGQNVTPSVHSRQAGCSTLGFDAALSRRYRQPATGPMTATRTGLTPASDDELTSQSSINLTHKE